MGATSVISNNQMHIIAQMYGDYVKEEKEPCSFDTWYRDFYADARLADATLSVDLNINITDSTNGIFLKIESMDGFGFIANKKICGITIPRGTDVKLVLREDK